MAKQETYKITINVKDNELRKTGTTAKRLSDDLDTINKKRLKIVDSSTKDLKKQDAQDRTSSRNKFMVFNKVHDIANRASGAMLDFGKASVDKENERQQAKQQLEASMQANKWTNKETADLMKQNAVIQKKGLMTEAQIQKAEQNLATFGAAKENMTGLAQAAAVLDAHAHNGATSVLGTKQAVDQLMKAIKGGSVGGLKKAGILVSDEELAVYKDVTKMKANELAKQGKVLTDKEKEALLVKTIVGHYGSLDKVLTDSQKKRNKNAEKQKLLVADTAKVYKQFAAMKTGVLNKLAEFVTTNPKLALNIMAIAVAVTTLTKAVAAFETIKSMFGMLGMKGKAKKTKEASKTMKRMKTAGKAIGTATAVGGAFYGWNKLQGVIDSISKDAEVETGETKKAGGGAIGQSHIRNAGDGFMANEAWIRNHERNKGKTVVVQINDEVIFDSFKKELNKKYVRNVYRK